MTEWKTEKPSEPQIIQRRRLCEKDAALRGDFRFGESVLDWRRVEGGQTENIPRDRGEDEGENQVGWHVK